MGLKGFLSLCGCQVERSVIAGCAV